MVLRSVAFWLVVVIVFIECERAHGAPPNGETDGASWRAGFAKVIITPDEPLWLSGYASRVRPAEGKVHDLWAKAAAFEGSDGARLVLVTMDLGSVNVHMTETVSARVTERFQLARANLVLNCSHTHCAPEISAERRLFANFSDQEEARIARYIERTNEKLVDLVGAALADLQPARISVSRWQAGFAYNRRASGQGTRGINPTGPVDRDVPVMRVADAEDRVRGILFGYACHNTTLNFQLFCGDYAGFAQYALEEAHPGAVAMFVVGCGGDQNPQPRRTLELAERHGRELAEAVERGLIEEQRVVRGRLRVAYDNATLDLEPLPTEATLRAQAEGPGSAIEARKTRYLLKRIEAEKSISLTQACPLHVAAFGDDLLMIFIGGETVVDYALRCKLEFAGPFVWVAGYNDDVFAYLPSRRVLLEGGYEGREGIIHQLVATPFLPNVEERLMGGIKGLVAQVQGKTSMASPSKEVGLRRQ